jgi:hypothetical protein
MNSTAFSFLANSNTELNGSQEMELTIGSLSIFVGPSGSSRLSDSTKPDPSVNKPKTEVMLESSEGSSSEVNSPVSLGKAPIAEGDKIRENFDLEERAYQTHNSARDFAAGNSSVSKKVQVVSDKGSRKIEILRPFGRRYAIRALSNPLCLSRWKKSFKSSDEGL